jgi:hypothetical protein
MLLKLCAGLISWAFSNSLIAIQGQCKRDNEMKFDANTTFTQNSKIDSGKRDAVLPKSGVQVAHSCPVLKGPTISLRAGRKPDACPAVSPGAHVTPGASAKSGRGVGRSPTAVAVVCSDELSADDLDRLIAVFQLLDQWERNSHAEKGM